MERDSLLVKRGGEVRDRSRGLSGENDGYIGWAGGTAPVIFELDEVSKAARRPAGELRRKRFCKCALCAGSSLNCSGGKAVVAALLAADGSGHIAFQDDFVGVMLWRGPGERDLIARSDGGKIRYALG